LAAVFAVVLLDAVERLLVVLISRNFDIARADPLPADPFARHYYGYRPVSVAAL